MSIILPIAIFLMELKKIKQQLEARLDTSSAIYEENYKELKNKLSDIDDLLYLAESGGVT